MMNTYLSLLKSTYHFDEIKSTTNLLKLYNPSSFEALYSEAKVKSFEIIPKNGNNGAFDAEIFSLKFL